MVRGDAPPIGEHSAVTDVYREAVSAVDMLRNADDVQDRLEAIGNLGVLSRLPEVPVAYVVDALRRPASFSRMPARRDRRSQ